MGKENKYKPNAEKPTKPTMKRNFGKPLQQHQLKAGEQVTHPPYGGPAASGLQKQKQEEEQGEWQTQRCQKRRDKAGEGWGGKQQQQQQLPQQRGQHRDPIEKQNQQQQTVQRRLQGHNEQHQGGSQFYGPPKPQDELPKWPRAQNRGLPLQPLLPQTQKVVPPLPAGTMKRGTLGKPGQVSVNYLDVNLDKMPAVAYQYDVKITSVFPKKFYRQAFDQYRVEHLGGAIAAYDGRASCYSVVKLKCSPQGQEVKVTDRHGLTLNYTVELKKTQDWEVDLSSLRSYMKDKIYDKPMRALQCLEVVLAAPCHNTARRAGRSFFKRSDPGNAFDLKDGYEALVGLHQTFVLGDRPFVNVDISHKAYPKAMSIIDYIEHYQRQKIDKSTNLDYRRSDIESFLNDIYIIYDPPACLGSAPRVFRVNGLSKAPASTQTFELDGKETTVAKYFKSREYDLKFPNLLCLHVWPPLKRIYLPIELCRMDDGQTMKCKDTAARVAAMLKFAGTSTNERKAKIVRLLEYFKHNLDPTISHFGIRLGNDFIVVNTRTLNAPQIEYKNNNLASVRNGSWRMDRMQFFEPKPKPHKWAILYGKINYLYVDELQKMVLQQSRTLNLCLDTKAEIRNYKDEREIDDHFHDFKKNQFDLVFVIIPNVGRCYDVVKQKAELKHGILTQCIKQITVERKCNPQCIGNVLLKNAMFLGADVSHPSPDQWEIPSVVGVAASHDPFGASYNMQYRLQRSTLEEIEDMESITLEHLRVYYQFRQSYPEHIIYYRDGVGDGQFPKIKSEELRGISAACCLNAFKLYRTIGQSFEIIYLLERMKNSRTSDETIVCGLTCA
ncbi:protein argonaute-2-like isoform X1 [Drosophila miranda]|uniref:protein argonaute-2-like isoform X1 n=1 Tax=Drosophila miranda TaxID=7229 RepID=UPI00143F4566|nr:protein argonaute-2-like isoform X1 [Drosophila miranda]